MVGEEETWESVFVCGREEQYRQINVSVLSAGQTIYVATIQVAKEGKLDDDTDRVIDSFICFR